MLKKTLIFPIKLYKKYISPHLGDNCRYWPSCSEYMMQAIEILFAAYFISIQDVACACDAANVMQRIREENLIPR